MKVASALLLLAVLVLGCSRQGGTRYKVEYKVTGTTHAASLTYNNAGGDAEQRDISLPWNKSFEVEYGTFLYISAQNKEEFGSITTTILVNGKQVKSSTSEGGFVIASSSYSCCDLFSN